MDGKDTKTVEDVIDIMEKWMWIEDEDQLKIIMAAAVASQFPGDPVWLMVIGPSGSAKTEMLRSFKGNSHVYTLDSLSSKSFISGFSRSSEFDLLPKLDKKLLIIKDLSVFLETGSQKDKDSVFSVLRQAYDGYYEATFGSVGLKSYTANFGLLCGVTDIVDHYSKIHSLLGERFLKLRIKYNRSKSIQAAFANSGHEEMMRKEIAEVVNKAFDNLISFTDVPSLTADTGKKIEMLGDCASILRSSMPRDWKHDIDYYVDPEVGTRLGKELFRLGKSLYQIGCWDYKLLTRIARDCSFPERLAIVDFLRDKARGTITEITENIRRFPRNTIKYGLEELTYLNVVDRWLESDTWCFRLKDEFAEKLKIAKL